VSDLGAADDGFHPIIDQDPYWTETTWWGFYAPDVPLGGMIYTLFRPAFGVASLVVQVWDADAVEPWRVPFSRCLWHLPMPAGELTDCSLGALRIQAIDPLHRYRVTHQDAQCTLDLEFAGLAAPFGTSDGGRGHFDQVCAVRGTVDVSGRRIEIDGSGGRDRSWYVRPDGRSLRAGYTFAVVDAGTHAVVHSFGSAEHPGEETSVLGGYLERGGERAKLVSGARHVVSRRRGHPDEVVIEAADAEGRRLELRGRVSASMASLSTPGMFAWMSTVDWTLDGAPAVGEDHDVWSPDLLALAAHP
jgi:hypothetical protein